MTARFLIVFLRVSGSVALCAVVAVLMPHHSMNVIHQWLGLGELPDEPIVGYLARSTSAFYALIGALSWIVSFDLGRYRTILLFLGWTGLVMGVALFCVDIVEGMPTYWIAFEGPSYTLFGILILCLARRVT